MEFSFLMNFDPQFIYKFKTIYLKFLYTIESNLSYLLEWFYKRVQFTNRTSFETILILIYLPKTGKIAKTQVEMKNDRIRNNEKFSVP